MPTLLEALRSRTKHDISTVSTVSSYKKNKKWPFNDVLTFISKSEMESWGIIMHYLYSSNKMNEVCPAKEPAIVLISKSVPT